MKFILLALLLLTSMIVQARTEAPTPPVPGPFQTQNAEYKFPASIDNDVLAGAATEIWARAFWPTDLSKPRPLVFLLHGNHSTCRENTNDDYDCTYTDEGSCPAGFTVIKNHEGFDYLAEQLASLGYIAVTINANRGITCGKTNDADWGLNLARGRLVLRHIELWNKWATAGGAPASLGVAASAFVGHVDITNVGLMGHSRGGEGMRAAAALYRDAGSLWAARIPNLKIRGIFEIGSVDGQAGRVLDADDMAWNQLLPMCDGDVSDLAGRLPFERMLQKSSEARKTPKSLTMVWGTNHNFYNSQWMTDESTNCLNHQEIHGPGPTSDKQQLIAKELLSSFMLANVGPSRDAKMGEVFDPSFAVPAALSSLTRVDRDNVYTFDRVFDAVVDDFDQASGVSSNRKTNSATGVTVKNDTSELPIRTEVAWTAAGANHYMQMNWEDDGHGRDVTNYTSLDLRVGRPLDQIREASTEFSIALVGSDGSLSSSVPVTRYGDVYGPGNEVNLYQTIRVPLADFALLKGFSVRGVRVIFDKTAVGALHFANVRFASNNPPFFASTRNAALPVLASIPSAPKSTNDPSSVLPSSPVTTPVVPSGGVVAPKQKPSFGFDPYASVMVNKARLTRALDVDASPYLSGRPGVEISVTAIHSYFPAEAQLPTLVLAGNKFSVSRYSSGKQGTLVFSVPQTDFDALPDRGAAWVQYGRTNARKVWKMPNFVKSELGR